VQNDNKIKPTCNGISSRAFVLEQVVQRSAGCPVPGDSQGVAGWCSEQPDLVEGVIVHCRGVGLYDL